MRNSSEVVNSEGVNKWGIVREFQSPYWGCSWHTEHVRSSTNKWPPDSLFVKSGPELAMRSPSQQINSFLGFILKKLFFSGSTDLGDSAFVSLILNYNEPQWESYKYQGVIQISKSSIKYYFRIILPLWPSVYVDGQSFSMNRDMVRREWLHLIPSFSSFICI